MSRYLPGWPAPDGFVRRVQPLCVGPNGRRRPAPRSPVEHAAAEGAD